MENETKNIATESGKKCPRPYRMGQRETAMETTRLQILAAARALILGENVLAGFSMELVARQAGVTRVTIYQRFGSKRGLLEALFDQIGTGGRLGERLPEVFTQPNARDALRRYIEVFCDFWGSDRIMNRRLRGFAALDTEFAAAIASRYERRHQAFDVLLSRLNADSSTPVLTTRDDLIQTLLSLTSFEFYDVLAGDRPPEEVAPIVFRLVMTTLGVTL